MTAARWFASTCVLVLATACGKAPPDPRAADCFAYTMPPGWQIAASKTAADLALAGPDEYPVGTASMHDTFTVRFLAGDVSLADLKQQLIAATPAVVNQLASDESHAHPDIPTIGVAASGALTFVPITLDGHDGFRAELHNTLTIGGQPIDRVNVTMFVKFGREIVDVAAGYLASRAAIDKPVSDAFLASISFARCAAPK